MGRSGQGGRGRRFADRLACRHDHPEYSGVVGTWGARALCFALVLLSVACSRFPIDTSDNPTAIPTASAVPASYTLTVRLSCFCAGLKYRVTVVDGEPRAVEYASGDPRDWDRKYRPLTIEEVDHLIARFASSADQVTVEGWPGPKSLISIDRLVNATDDELYYTVTVEPTA